MIIRRERAQPLAVMNRPFVLSNLCRAVRIDKDEWDRLLGKRDGTFSKPRLTDRTKPSPTAIPTPRVAWHN